MSAMKHDKDVEKSTPRVKREGGTDKTAVNAPHVAPTVTKKGARWTAIDSVILLLAVLAIAGAIVRGVLDRRQEGNVSTEGPYYVNFTISEIHTTVLSEIQKMDPLYLYDTDERIGYIGVYTDGTIALRAVAPVAVGNNSVVSAEGCMICLEGIYKNGSLLVSGMDTYIAPGSVLHLRTDRATFTVEITDIWVAD